MSRQPDYKPRDMYELYHLVDARNPRNFFAGHHIISDQIEREALLVIWQELDSVMVKKVPGAITEFGCYIGTTSLYLRRLLDERNQSQKRELHAYDSFEGLPVKGAKDMSAAGTEFKEGALRVHKKQFMEQFRRAGLKPPIVHKGWFKDLTEAEVPEKIAFAFLDGDFYDSIRDSLQLVVPRMQQGGVIIVDDYAREALPGAAKAVHEYFSPSRVQTSHNLGIIRL